MTGQVDKRQRWGALAATIAFMAALALLTVAPHIGAHVASEEIAASRAALSGLDRLAGRGPELRDRNAAIRSARDQLELLLAGETTGIAGAELQRFLLERTSHHKGTATTVLVQAPQLEGGLIRISTLLSVRIGIRGLRDLLHDLETGLPLLFVSELSVRTLDGSAKALLDVRMRVGGYLPKREGS